MKIFKHLLLVFSILFLYGCPLYTEHPLGESGTEKIDTKLLGTWENNVDGTEVKKVRIDKRNKFEYTVKVLETGTNFYEETYDFKAWVITIAEKKFLYFQPQDTKNKTYYYYAYELNDNGFTSQEINGELVHGDHIHSTQELRGLIKENLNTEGFLTSEIQWVPSK